MNVRHVRGWLACMLLLGQASAGAGTLDKCQAEKKDTDAVQLCVETEQLRSANQLRKVSTKAKAAVRDKTQQDGRRAILREYRSVEARHVRERSIQCRQQPAGIERLACEADMNDAHIGQLARFIQ